MSVTDAVQRFVDAQGDLDELGQARAALALRLATVLDSGQGLMATAAISRELRETLADLAGEGNANDELGAFIADLSTAVRNPAVI